MAKVYDNATDLITFARLQAQNTTSGSSYLGSDGLLKFAAEDEPRIEYGSDGSLKGLLIEEQRTNLLRYSEDTNINYSNEVSKHPDAMAWLTGETTADLIVPTTVNSQHYFGYSSSYSAGTSNETYSFFAKASGYHRFRVYLANQSSGYQADFDLSAETATNTGSAVGQSIENFGGGWFRCSMTFLSTKVNPYPSVKIFDNAGNETFSGDGASGIYFTGQQLEQGSFVTSYIPTSGSTVTRSPDLASIPVSAFGYNQDAGTVVVEYDSVAPNTATNRRAFALTGDPVGHEQVSIYASSGYLHRGYVVNDGAVIALPIGATGWTENQFYKSALTIDATDATISVDGAAAVTDPTGSMPTIDTLALGSQATSGNYLNGHIKSLKYYPRRLTDAQLQELTA